VTFMRGTVMLAYWHNLRIGATMIRRLIATLLILSGAPGCKDGTDGSHHTQVEQVKNMEPAVQRIAPRAAGTSDLFKSCSAGNGLACYEAGMRCEKGEGTSVDLAKARDLFEKGCEVGGFTDQGSSCCSAGLYWTFGTPFGLPVDREHGKKLLEKGCQLGYQHACTPR
jgi:hypothetical protein